MSTYTTEERWIVEDTLNREGIEIADPLTNCTNAEKFIFSQEHPYPIWDEDHRQELNEKILAAYYDREIGLETAELWKFKLNADMLEIMPRYCDLAKAQAAMLLDPYGYKDFRTLKRDVTGHEDDTTDTQTDGTSGQGSTTATHTDTTGAKHIEASDNRDTTGAESYTKAGKSSEDMQDSTTGQTSGHKETAGTSQTDGTQSKSTQSSESGQDSYTESETEKHSETPMGGIELIDLENGAYLTTADINAKSHSGTNSKTGSGSENGTTSETGKTSGTEETTGATSGSETRHTEGTTGEDGSSESTGNEKGWQVSQEDDTSTSDTKTDYTQSAEHSETGSTAGQKDTQQITGEKEKKHGYNADRIALYARLVETYTNLDQMIIDDLAPLYMGVY